MGKKKSGKGKGGKNKGKPNSSPKAAGGKKPGGSSEGLELMEKSKRSQLGISALPVSVLDTVFQPSFSV